MIIPGTHPVRVFTVCPLLVTLKVPTITLLVDSVTPHSSQHVARGGLLYSRCSIQFTLTAHAILTFLLEVKFRFSDWIFMTPFKC